METEVEVGVIEPHGQPAEAARGTGNGLSPRASGESVWPW